MNQFEVLRSRLNGRILLVRFANFFYACIVEGVVQNFGRDKAAASSAAWGAFAELQKKDRKQASRRRKQSKARLDRRMYDIFLSNSR
jgi:hypothetical protein